MTLKQRGHLRAVCYDKELVNEEQEAALIAAYDWAAAAATAIKSMKDRAANEDWVSTLQMRAALILADLCLKEMTKVVDLREASKAKEGGAHA